MAHVTDSQKGYAPVTGAGAGSVPVLSGLLLMLLLAGPVLSNETAAIEKKLQLIEQYLFSDTADRIASSDNQTALDFLKRTRQLVSLAQQALESGDLTNAESSVMQALQSYSSASIALQRSAKSDDSGVRKQNRQLLEEIKAYRESFISGLEQKGPAFASLLDISVLESLLEQAEQLSRQKQHRQAHKTLQKAYQMTVNAVTRLRENETVVYALDFRTAADEYRYEQKRHQSYEILVQQLRDAGKDKGSAGALVAKFVDSASDLTRRAGEEAANGDFEQAIKTMEEANRNLSRALQMMGLPIPG